MFIETSLMLLAIASLVVIVVYCSCLRDAKIKKITESNEFKRVDDLEINKPVVVVAVLVIIGLMFWVVGL